MFDENISPFSNICPNTGARLRAEISLLPSILLNPSMRGVEHVDDHVSDFPNDGDQVESFQGNRSLGAQPDEVAAAPLADVAHTAGSAEVPDGAATNSTSQHPLHTSQESMYMSLFVVAPSACVPGDSMYMSGGRRHALAVDRRCTAPSTCVIPGREFFISYTASTNSRSSSTTY